MDGEITVGRFSDESVFDVLHRIESTEASGSIRFEGVESGTLFFDQGRLYFAMLDGHPLSLEELAAAGIDQSIWQDAGRHPDARGHFARVLLSLGCPRSAVENFILNRINTWVRAMATAPDGIFTRSNRRHGFGAAVSYAASAVATDLQGPPPPATVCTDDTLISLARTGDSQIRLDSEIWNTLVDLVPPMRFAELKTLVGKDIARMFMTRLEQGDLVNLVVPLSDPAEGTDDEPRVSRDQTDRATPNPDTLASPEPYSAPIAYSWESEDEDDGEYVPERVGRQTYAAIANMRASRAELPPQEKAHALRRLIEAVKGL